MMLPASQLIDWPVMVRLSSLARKRARLPMSSGWEIVRSGT